MLHALELENFKAFGERARIPFAPITLIFGENSAGKSTILQALNLLKQTRESREADVPLLLRGGNEIVDLGSFQELLFNHDLKRTLSVRVEAAVDRRSPFRSSYKKNKIAIEFSFKRSPTQPEVLLEQIGIYGMESSECIAKFQPLGTLEKPGGFSRRVGFYGNRFFDTSRSFSSSRITSLKCVDLTEETEYWEQEFKWCKDNEEQICSRLEEKTAHLDQLLERQADEEIEDGEQEYSNEESNRLQKNIDILSGDLKFFLSDFDLEAYISKRQQEEMDTIMDVQGFLPIQIRYRERSTIITRVRSLLDRQSDPLDRQSDNIVFNVTEFVMLAGRALEKVLEVLFPMGPFWRPPERWYIFRGTTPQDVGYRGNLLPDLLFRNSKLVKEADKWLKQLEIGYKLKVESVGDRSRALETLVRRGEHNALEIRRANILLKADVKGPAWTDAQISEAFGCHPQTVYNVRKRWTEREGLPALKRKPQSRPSRLPKLDGPGEARLIALCCSDPPEGFSRWTLQLLADKLVELELVESISLEAVRKTLKKTPCVRIGSRRG